MNTRTHDVAIVGAGPTGLALGAELKRLGVSAVIFDRLEAGANTSRALVIHARTLEVLESLEVTPRLLDSGVKVPIFRARDRSRILATVDFGNLQTRYPFTLMCPQSRTEALLLERLESLGGSVERPSAVLSIDPGTDGVEVRLSPGGRPVTVHAKWLVGCDGVHSLVREQSSIPFEGDAYEESFVLGDVEMDWPISREEVTLFFSENGFLVVGPMPGGNSHYRIVATLDNPPQPPSLIDFKNILAERGPDGGGVSVRQLIWSSRFHLQHRVAKMLRKGRVLLAGDAAHVHSPAGGQGMNTGIQEAIGLAGALRSALETGTDDAINGWHSRRLEIDRSVVELTHRMTRVATLSSPALKVLRNTAIGIVGHIPLAQHALAETLAELKNR